MRRDAEGAVFRILRLELGKQRRQKPRESHPRGVCFSLLNLADHDFEELKTTIMSRARSLVVAPEMLA